MVQIIQENRRPSGAERFSEALGRGAQQLNDFHQQRHKGLADEREFSEQNDRYKQLTGRNLSRDPKIREKEIDFALRGELDQNSIVNKLLGQQQLAKMQGNEPKEPSVAEKKFAKEQEDEANVRRTAQTSFNTLNRLLKRGNVGFGSSAIGSVIGGDYARDVGEFQTAAGGLEAMLVDMVSRGTLSNSRFEYITENLLPKPTDRQATIEGKLKALGDLLGLEVEDERSSSVGMKPGVQKQSLQEIFS